MSRDLIDVDNRSLHPRRKMPKAAIDVSMVSPRGIFEIAD